MKTRSPQSWVVALAAFFIALPYSPAMAQRAASSERRTPMKFDRSFGREQSSIKKAFGPVVEEAARSTHKVLSEGSHIALATAVHADGWLLTKASELQSKEKLEVEFSGGLRLPVTVSDRLEAYDLALLKVDARGLKAVSWSERPVPEAGSFLAAPHPYEGVAAVGVASVGLRNRYQPPRGYMGVQLQWKDGEPASIQRVFEGGAAAEAGLQEGDVILAVDGVTVNGREALVGEISRRRPGQEVTLKVKRGDEEIEVGLTLMDRRESMGPLGLDRDPMVLMSGRLSRQRHSFFNVFQHDLVLAPEECGGPLVDLEGHVVGLDIARSGRVESLAIPAADLKNLLAQVTTGKFTLPDMKALRDELKKAELAIRVAQDARDLAELSLRRATELHATLPAPLPEATADSPATPTESPQAPAMPVQSADAGAPPEISAPAGMP